MATIMQVLHVFEEDNYELSWNRLCREAVRAIIIDKDKIAMVKSTVEGFYKFPGGGIEDNETHTDTIIRETYEEVGLHIIPTSIKDFGMLQEIRKDLYNNEIFDQKSYYYFASVSSDISNQTLDDYEFELGYELSYVDIKIAYETNIELYKDLGMPFLRREAYILNLLLNLIFL